MPKQENGKIHGLEARNNYMKKYATAAASDQLPLLIKPSIRRPAIQLLEPGGRRGGGRGRGELINK